MKIGTRLALVLLLALTPVVAVYSYFNIHISSQIFIRNLKREVRATTRSLRAALFHDVDSGEWFQVRAILEQVRVQGTEAALFKPDGTLWFALPSFPAQLFPTHQAFASITEFGSYETDKEVADRYWFCRLVPLSITNDSTLGYLLVADDLTQVREERQRRTASAVTAAVLVLVIAGTIVTLATRRYVTRPLADLSRRVMQFSASEELDRWGRGDEVESLGEEFRRLDGQLTSARERLFREHRRQLELERNLRHSDKLATIGTLASGLAHEIGSPMAVIRGRAEYLLHSTPDSDKLKEGLGIIIAQIDRISGIVHRLLDYARRREPLRVRSDLRPIVLRALGLLETEAARRHVKIETELGQVPLVVDCDTDQLQQVFVNLGMNALDAMTEQGNGLLRVSAERRSAAPNGNRSRQSLRVVFEDSGLGVPVENRAHIFDPFFTTKAPGKGTGMGLAVSQSIVQDHDGEITMEPGLNGGARFFVILPAAIEEGDAKQANL